MTKQSPKVTLSDTVELTKEEQLMQKLRESRELREKLVQTDDPEVALKAINDSGIDLTDDEFEVFAMKHFEMIVFHHKMSEKAIKIHESGVIPRSVIIFGAPSFLE